MVYLDTIDGLSDIKNIGLKKTNKQQVRLDFNKSHRDDRRFEQSRKHSRKVQDNVNKQFSKAFDIKQYESESGTDELTEELKTETEL